MYLRNIQRVKRLDWMMFKGKGDHAWVVIGRALGSHDGDYRRWGPNAVVCDPWGDVVFPAIQVPQTLPRYGEYHHHGYMSSCSTGTV
jgi:hypothetical protein